MNYKHTIYTGLDLVTSYKTISIEQAIREMCFCGNPNCSCHTMGILIVK